MKTTVTIEGIEIELTPEQKAKLSDALAAKSVNKICAAKRRFIEMLQGLEIRTDFEKAPHSVFFFKGGNYWFEIEKNTTLWCHPSKVWFVFESEFGMKYTEIQAFIKDMVEEYFKLNGLTPSSVIWPSSSRVEEYFKLKQTK